MERLGTKALLSALGEWSEGHGGSLHRRLYGAFQQAIETGVLEPGIVLPAERTLARTLGVSRSTITNTLAELKTAGLLESRHGSGTRVVGERGDQGGAIDLASSSPADAGALPDVDLDLDVLLQAGSRHGLTPAGLPELRAAVAARFAIDGLATDPDQVLITNGAQHAIALAFAQLASPGDRVIVDEPTYPGVIDLLTARQLVAVPLARPEGAIDLDGLRRLSTEHRCQLAYLQTSVHNPSGRVATGADLDRLAVAVDEIGMTVIEDLVLADLRFDGVRPAPLAARTTSSPVVSVGSVSKLGWGGLRIGWLRGPDAVVKSLIRSRLVDDLGSSVPSQLISTALLGEFDVIAESRQRTLAGRAELAQSLLAELCPEWQTTTPAGGLSLWIDLGTVEAHVLATKAAAHGVIVATGDAASVASGGQNHIRVCFDRPVPQLREGLQRLATANAELREG